MNCFEKVKAIADELNIYSCPDIYTKGDKSKWITYELYQRLPHGYSDNVNAEYVDYLQIHLFIPINFNYFELMTLLGDKLTENGFVPAEVTTSIESDQKLRHLVYSTSITEE